MDIDLDLNHRAAEVSLRGRFDFSAHHKFREACNKALEHLSDEIHIDLAGVEYVDSAALGMLLLLKDKCAVSARRLILRRPSAEVLNIFNVANFSRLFEIRDTAGG